MARKTNTTARITPQALLQTMCGYRLTSLGDFERLAGVDTCNAAERIALWSQFRDLYAASMKGDHQPLFDAVTRHCAEVALNRIRRGELALLPVLH